MATSAHTTGAIESCSTIDSEKKKKYGYGSKVQGSAPLSSRQESPPCVGLWIMRLMIAVLVPFTAKLLVTSCKPQSELPPGLHREVLRQLVQGSSLAGYPCGSTMLQTTLFLLRHPVKLLSFLFADLWMSAATHNEHYHSLMAYVSLILFIPRVGSTQSGQTLYLALARISAPLCVATTLLLQPTAQSTLSAMIPVVPLLLLVYPITFPLPPAWELITQAVWMASVITWALLAARLDPGLDASLHSVLGSTVIAGLIPWSMSLVRLLRHRRQIRQQRRQQQQQQLQAASPTGDDSAPDPDQALEPATQQRSSTCHSAGVVQPKEGTRLHKPCSAADASQTVAAPGVRARWPRPTYQRRFQQVTWHCKLPHVEPEQLPADYVARLQKGVADMVPADSGPRWQLAAVYVRRGCVQLALRLLLPLGVGQQERGLQGTGSGGGNAGGLTLSPVSPRPPLSAEHVLGWLGLPWAPGITVAMSASKGSRITHQLRDVSGGQQPAGDPTHGQQESLVQGEGYLISVTCVSYSDPGQEDSAPPPEHHQSEALVVVVASDGRCCVSLPSQFVQRTAGSSSGGMLGMGQPHAGSGPVIFTASMQGRCLPAQLEADSDNTQPGSSGSGQQISQAAVAVEGIGSNGLLLLEAWTGSVLLWSGVALVVGVAEGSPPSQALAAELRSLLLPGAAPKDSEELDGDGAPPAFLEDLGLWWDWLAGRRRAQGKGQANNTGTVIHSASATQDHGSGHVLLASNMQESDCASCSAVQQDEGQPASFSSPLCHTAVAMLCHAYYHGLPCMTSRLLSDLAQAGRPPAWVRQAALRQGGASLLLQALASGCPGVVQALLDWGRQRGQDWDWGAQQEGLGGLTPLDLLRADPQLAGHMAEWEMVEGQSATDTAAEAPVHLSPLSPRALLWSSLTLFPCKDMEARYTAWLWACRSSSALVSMVLLLISMAVIQLHL